MPMLVRSLFNGELQESFEYFSVRFHKWAKRCQQDSYVVNKYSNLINMYLEMLQIDLFWVDYC